MEKIDTLSEMLTKVPEIYDTFLIMKPEFLNDTIIVLNTFTEEGYHVVRSYQKTISYNEAQELYTIHKSKPFYEELCTYMSSGESCGYLIKSPYFEVQEAVAETTKWKEYFRKKYGKDDMRNVLHSSDSIENVKREATLFFASARKIEGCISQKKLPNLVK